jgi:hypothetical protein
MKEGWTIAIGTYHGVSVHVKHCSILESYSEAVLCPVNDRFVPYNETQELLKISGIDLAQELKGLKPGSAKDIPSGELLQTRLIACILPDKDLSDDTLLRAFKSGLDISNGLGCISTSVRAGKYKKSLEESIEILIESIEAYALTKLDAHICMKDVIIFVQTPSEIAVALEALKFRMTRYNTFINIGLPNQNSLHGFYYCYECYKIYKVSETCEHVS